MIVAWLDESRGERVVLDDDAVYIEVLRSGVWRRGRLPVMREHRVLERAVVGLAGEVRR